MRPDAFDEWVTAHGITLSPIPGVRSSGRCDECLDTGWVACPVPWLGEGKMTDHGGNCLCGGRGKIRCGHRSDDGGD